MNLSKLREKYSASELLWFSALWLQFFRLLVLNLPKHHWIFAPCLDYINVLIWGLCAYKFFFFDHHKAKTLWFSGVVFYGALLSAMIVDSEDTREMLNLFVFVLSCKDVSFRKITRHYLVYYSLFLCENLLITALGFAEITVFSGRFGMLRLRLNFDHYNHLGAWLMLIILTSMLALYKKKDIRVYLCGIAASCLLLYLTSSRTAFIVALLGTILLCLQSRHPNTLERIPKFRVWATLMPLGLIALMFLLTILYDKNNSFFAMLPGTFAARLSLGQQYLMDSRFHLFGTTIPSPMFLDFMFLSMAHYNGIICTIAYTVLLVLSSHRAAVYKQWDVWIVIIMIVFFSLSEMYMRTFSMMMLYPAFAKLDE